MKITLLHEYGAKRHYEAVYYLKKIGFVSDIIEIQFNLLRKILLHRDPLASLKNLKSLYALFLSSQQNIIVGAAPYDPIIPYLIRLKKRHNIIHHTSWLYWGGSKHPKRLIYPLQKDLWMKYLQNLFVVTPTETARKNLLTTGAKAFRIPHSVNTNIFTPAKKKISDATILYVGRLGLDKGVDCLLKLAKKWQHKPVKFCFVGKGKLRSQIIQMQDKYPVSYLGYISSQEKLAEVYRQASVLVLPASRSYEEVFGIVLIEAMASGLPVVAVDSVGPSEIIDNGVNGDIVPRDNVKRLEDSLEYLLMNPESARKMGLEGRKKALRNYSYTEVSKMWQQVMLAARFSE